VNGQQHLNCGVKVHSAMPECDLSGQWWLTG